MIEREHCPISGRPARVLYRRLFDLPAFAACSQRAGMAEGLRGKAYEIRFAPESGLYFQRWVMEEEALSGWYAAPAGARHFWDEIGRQRLHWFGHMTEEILVMRQMIARAVPAVLDFGCNWGKWASMALAHGCEVYGVDVNRAAAEFCAQRGIRMIAREEMRRLRFDFINVDQVLEHLSDPLGVARELAGCLAPGGYMKWSTPGNRRLPALLAALEARGGQDVPDADTLDSLAPLEHVNLFSNQSLRYLAGRVGLEPVALPLWKWLGAGQLWNLPRQLNRNLRTPFKRWRMRGEYLWFQKA